MTSDRISLILELVEIFWLFYIGFTFLSAAVVCATHVLHPASCIGTLSCTADQQTEHEYGRQIARKRPK